ncbi:AAA family ATPase [Peristeroidobacter soli]|uniref:AAA family ATPase n=1 Tax=Peristeroidobacter soli TaxID=2497877 RepID=UPI00101C1B94|nr:AAA family ATPase [Peristeroidobacter soli]
MLSKRNPDAPALAASSFIVLPQERVELTPAQRVAYRQVTTALQIGPLAVISGEAGSGKRTVLAQLARDLGARLIGADELQRHLMVRDENTRDIATFEYLERAVVANEVTCLWWDDTHLEIGALSNHMQPEIHGVLVKSLFRTLQRAGHKLIVAGPPKKSYAPSMLHTGYAIGEEIPSFAAEDYRVALTNMIGETRVGNIDCDAMFRHAPLLNMHDLKVIARALLMAERDGDRIGTASVLRVIDAVVREGNVNLKEVEDVTFDLLPGAEHIRDALEKLVVRPIELASSMPGGVKPKRGVLLYGPPGTGKTSIGRALANRMGGRFFLIDGSMLTEPPGAFFEKFLTVVHDAMREGPSVLFIDDADVLFEIVHISGLTRYLLTLLDGLESESSRNVCVVLTAMDPRKVPEAILRSGRIELWLEARRPMAETRARMIQRWLHGAMPREHDVDLPKLGELTSGFIAADLRRIVMDAQCLYGMDLHRRAVPQAAQHYLERAIVTLKQARNRMAEVLGKPEMRIP